MKSQFLRLPLAALFLATTLAPGRPLLAHEGGSGESHQLLMVQPIPETGGRHVVMVTVSYAPRQVSRPHVHPGPVFAYVLEGSVVSQLEGQSARTYTKGQSWYEPPYAHHLVSRNASATAPAKLLVWALVGEHAPIKLPLPAFGKNQAKDPPSR